MDNFIDKINTLVQTCDRLTHDILAEEPCTSLAGELCAGMAALIKDIVELYSQPEYSVHVGDIPAWTDLARRLIDACNGDDILNLLDLVSYELKYNLLELKSYVEGYES